MQKNDSTNIPQSVIDLAAHFAPEDKRADLAASIVRVVKGVVANAVAAEREACAQIADGEGHDGHRDSRVGPHIAGLIRARDAS